MRRNLWAALGGAALVCLWSGEAHATCATAQGTVIGEQSVTPLAGRFAELMAADRFSDSAAQAERWRSFLAEAAKSADATPAMLVQAQTWLAWSLEYSDQADAALSEGRKALAMLDRYGMRGSGQEAETLTVMATIQTDNKDVAGAAISATRALQLAEHHFGAESAEASFAHNGLGTVAYAQGRYVDAEREYGASARLAEACLSASDPLIVNQMASHAGTLYMIGRTEDALEEAQRAANWAMANVAENNPVVTLALGNLGTLLIVTGRYAEAEVALRKVVDLEGVYQSESWFYRAISLSNYAEVLNTLGRHEEAETLWLASVAFHQKATIGRDPISPAYPMRFAADAAQQRGDLALALERRDKAVEMIDAAAPEDNPERARTHLERAVTLLAMNRAKEAFAIAGPAMAVVRSPSGYGEGDTRRMWAEIANARILARNGQPEQAFALVEGIATGLEKRLLDAATNRGDLVRYGPAFSASFSTMTELALETGRKDAAFRYLQLANLSDIVLVTSEVAARAVASDPETAQRIRAFQDRLRRRQALDRERSFALGAGDGARVSQLAEQIAENDRFISEVGAELDRIAPQFRTIGRPTPVELADYQSRLAPEEALLAPIALDDVTLSVLVTRDGFEWARSPVSKARIDGDVHRLRGALDQTSADAVAGKVPFDFAAARRLHSALIPEAFAKTLAAKPDLVYFASGALASLPLSVLVTSDEGLDSGLVDLRKVHWLLRDHSVRIAPSLLPVSQVEVSRRKKPRFLGVGAPDLIRSTTTGIDLADLPPLPGAERELDRMAKIIGRRRSTLLTGSDASEASLGGLDLSRFSVIAFATHGLVSGERAGVEEPALVLSADEGGGDGLLTASEVMQWRLDADWVILSACNTASGDIAGGPTFGGLAAAFTHAGARSLLLSHWPVRDDVAARLVGDALSKSSRGQSSAQALREAQLAMIDDVSLAGGEDPSLWAPFVLVGR